MAERKEAFVTGEFYHLYNRGVEKRVIFKDRQDYQHFLLLMYICNSERSIVLRDIGKEFERGDTIVDIGLFCLMPNHFHIVVREKEENGISTYMRKLMTAYSMYFNKKYKRTGRLYEGPFKSVHCKSDRYLKYLYAYIHLNPAKLKDKNWRKNTGRNAQELLKYTWVYPYSSTSEYRGRFHIINPTPFPKYFASPTGHLKELFSWLKLEPNPIGNSYGVDDI